jgi:hypothetical protein
VHKGIVGFDDSKLRREEELEALPREVVWMRPPAAQHVTVIFPYIFSISEKKMTKL